MIDEFGKIRVDNSNDSSLPVVQYTGKVRPVVSVGTQGNGRGEFKIQSLFEFGSDKMVSLSIKTEYL